MALRTSGRARMSDATGPSSSMRIGREKLSHPARSRAKGTDVWLLDQAGCVAVNGSIERGALRLADLYEIAQRNTKRPVKASVGAGPVQLATCAVFKSGPIKNRY